MKLEKFSFDVLQFCKIIAARLVLREDELSALENAGGVGHSDRGAAGSLVAPTVLCAVFTVLCDPFFDVYGELVLLIPDATSTSQRTAIRDKYGPKSRLV